MIYKSIHLALEDDADVEIQYDGDNHVIIECLNEKHKPVFTHEMEFAEAADFHAALGELLGVAQKSRKP